CLKTCLKRIVTKDRNNGSSPRTRRVVFVAAPGTEILDLVGPLQVFARAAEMFGKQNPGSPPIYSVEVISASSQRSLVTNCGVRIAAHRTFREVRGQIDTLLVAGGRAPTLIPTRYLFATKIFTPPLGSRREWISPWRWWKKITIRVWRCRSHVTLFSICGVQVANRNSALRCRCN